MKLGLHKRLARHFPTVAFILLFGEENIPRSEYEQCPGLVNILGKLKECYNEEMNSINPNLTLWNTMHLIATHCGTHFLRDYVFNTTFHSNMDDSKAIIYPDDRNAEIHSVTAGIGDDIIVEQQLKAGLPNAHFYGADPFTETARVFREIGAVAKINVEIHGPMAFYGKNDSDFDNMVKTVLSPRSPYIPLWVPYPYVHQRFFLFNWKSAECLKKFLPNWC